MTRSIDRRTVIKTACATGLALSPLLSTIASATGRGSTRYVFIRKSIGDQTFLDLAAGAILRKDRNFHRNLQVLTMSSDLEKIEALIQRYGPATEVIEWPLVVAIPPAHTSGNEVEIWSPQSVRFAEDGLIDACYPVSGGWWSVEGDWNPTADKVRRHLFESPNHTEGEFTQEWLDLLNRSELQSIHSDHHREMIGQGSVHWQNVNGECPAP